MADLASYAYALQCMNKQKAVANCVWMLVVKIKSIERIY